MKRYIGLFIAFFLLEYPCFSQINLQVYGSYVKNLNADYKGTTYGGGIRIEFGDDEATLNPYAGFAYNRPIITRTILVAQAMSNFTDPSSIEVEAVYKIPNYRFEFGTRFYLAGSAHDFEAVNAYFNIGGEIILGPNKPKYEDFDRELYTLGYTQDSDVNEDGSDKFALNLMLALGVGVEKNIGPGNIFAHINFALPANRSGGNDISSSIVDFTPIPLNFNIGYKFPLGSSY